MGNNFITYEIKSKKQQSSGNFVTPSNSHVTLPQAHNWFTIDGDMAIQTLQQAITYYKTVARSEIKSEKTITWVASAAGYFANFFPNGDPPLNEITAHDLRRFIIALRETKKYSKHPFCLAQDNPISSLSINSYVRAIRALWGFLLREGVIPVNAMLQVKPPKAQKKIIQPFTEEHLKLLLAQPDKGTSNGYRDYAIMLLLLDSCIRLSELTNLQIDDVNIEERFFKVTGKGDKQRIVPVGGVVAGVLARYIMKYRPKGGSPNVFLSHSGRPLTGNNIERIIRAYGKKAGIKGVRLSPHTFRHSGAVQFLRNGGDSFALQRILGHSSLEMTRKYCQLSSTDVREAHRKFSPVDRLF